MIAVNPPQRSVKTTFQVSQAMVKRFADLTGDQNPLHLDPNFGRRSAYKDNIVHGILPVIYASLIKTKLPSENSHYLQQLSVRFLEPIIADELMLLDIQPAETDDGRGRQAFDFTISNTATKNSVTTGQIVFGETALDPNSKLAVAAESLVPLITDKLAPASTQLDDINEGDKRQLAFCPRKSQTSELKAILIEGLNDDFAIGALTMDANWLTTCLFSTFVGMLLPGKHAIFVDMKVDFIGLTQWSVEYVFEGTVRRVARSMKTIAQNAAIHPAGNPKLTLASGRMSARVDDPPVEIPSYNILKQTKTNLGLAGKVVLVTGAGRGIGEAIVKLLAAYGANVAINYLRSKAEANRIAAEIKKEGGRALVLQADVTDQYQVQQMVQDVSTSFGTIDVLVNNAASNYLPTDFLNLTWDVIQNDIDVIVRGAFNCCQAVLPLMLANEGGRIINISSTATDVPPKGQTKYVIAKSGLVGLTRSLAIEFAANNILVNTVVPSLVLTDFTRHVSPLALKQLEIETPMARHATAIDVAKAVVFLASSLSSFTTGEKIMVTGGNPPLL